MKRSLICFMILLAAAFSYSNADAQAGKATKSNPAAPARAAAAIPKDEEATNASMEVYPNPTDGMLTVKTECAGKIFFYSQKGKQKGGCIVNGGDNIIYLESVLNPGVYICRFEGVNGSIAETRVTYKL